MLWADIAAMSALYCYQSICGEWRSETFKLAETGLDDLRQDSLNAKGKPHG